MSGGDVCRCAEARKPIGERAWVVTQRRCNHSAFNGYRRTPSNYSAVRCLSCHSVWRTDAHYVTQLKDVGDPT